MAQRTCEIEGCERPHQARGMCGAHYGTWYKRTHEGAYRRSKESEKKHQRTCIVCGTLWLTTRKEAKLCSDVCRGKNYATTMQTRCELPADHVVRVAIAQAQAARAELAAERRREKQRSKFEWRTARECPGCACWFTPLFTSITVCCSKKCSAKMARQRRRAREHGAVGSFTWSDFMRIARKFNYCCAYCGVKPKRLDPDHVVPLSRGGSNSPTNLLPTCYMCNSSKCAMTLPEWDAWLAERGREPRVTTWSLDDPRYSHLTDALLVTKSAA